MVYAVDTLSIDGYENTVPSAVKSSSSAPVTKPPASAPAPSTSNTTANAPRAIISKANRVIVVPETPATLNLFPSALKLPHGKNGALVVPHKIPETLLLRHLGYKIPNPMITYYDWAGGTPFAVQKRTCELLTENERAYVLNHMGTGKTKAALWAWRYLHEEGMCGRLWVVAPLSTLNFVWAREAFATLPEAHITVLHGNRAIRLERLRDNQAEILIINHDGVKVIQKEIEAMDTSNDILVLDELAVYRNNSDRSKQMRKLAQRFKCVWGMTGAPMPNEPVDVWAQCKIVTPHTVPKYQSHARDMLMTRVNNYLWKPKPDAVDNAFKMMQPAVRYALDDVVELPEVIHRTIDVDLTKEQKKEYHKLSTAFRTLIQNKEITAMNAGVAMGKLLQVACGWVYTKNPEFVRLDAQPRIDTVLDIVEACETKVLLFVPFRHALAGLSGILSDEGIEHCVVHGATSGRDHLFNLFQNTSKYHVLAAHPECLSHGLTLTAASTIIWYCPLASLDIYDQANARIRRVGQVNKQQILHLQSTPVERKLYSLLRSKQRIQDKLLSLFEEATQENIT